jgi:L-amino acid N-acyltransferase YncA
MPRLTQAMRAALLNLDGRDRAALVAEIPDRAGWRPIGIARLARTGAGQAELAITVVDAWQRRGIGHRLTEALGALAKELGYRELHGLVLPENDRVVRLLQRVFPGTLTQRDEDVLLVRCPLGPPEVTHDDLLAALVSR